MPCACGGLAASCGISIGGDGRTLIIGQSAAEALESIVRLSAAYYLLDKYISQRQQFLPLRMDNWEESNG